MPHDEVITRVTGLSRPTGHPARGERGVRVSLPTPPGRRVGAGRQPLFAPARPSSPRNPTVGS